MLLKGGKYLNKAFKFEEGNLYIQNGLIAESSSDNEVLDITGLTVLPGLIDIHIHGFAGGNIASTNMETLNNISNVLLKCGVTSIVPTLSTRSHAELIDSLTVLNKVMNKGTEGSEFLGINLEGPYLNIKKKGGMVYQHIRPFKKAEFEEYLKVSENKIKLITIAPEIEENFNAIKYLTDKGVTVSIGHTVATAEETERSIDEGLSHVTHLFNAMVGINHREPGVVGAVFDSDITAELICDGHHINERIIRMVYKLLGRERLIFISDTGAMGGLPDGEYIFDGLVTIIKGDSCTLQNGTINGNANDLFTCLKRLVNFGIPLEDAVYCTSYTPAKRVGVLDRKGSIDIKKDADLVIVDDSLNIKYVIKNGTIKHKK